MEFKEFSNPLEQDYDVNSSLKEEPTTQKTSSSPYQEVLDEILSEFGLLEDSDLEQIGITFEEYLYPNKETIMKIREYLKTNTNNKTR